MSRSSLIRLDIQSPILNDILEFSRSSLNNYFKYFLNIFFLQATIECCKILLNRLEPIKQQNPGIAWKDLISKANDAHIDLCAEYMFVPEVVS